MPCIIVTGHPSSGKTTVANLLKQRALQHEAIDEVILINEESEFGGGGYHNNNNNNIINNNNDKNNPICTATRTKLLENSAAEKVTRGALKSAFDRAVGSKVTADSATNTKNKNGDDDDNDDDATTKRQRRLIILDSLNYIKGYRYELWCISKAANEVHGILWVLNQPDVVRRWNETTGAYPPKLLDELIQRYEPPDERNRWDRPLFTVDVSACSIQKAASDDASDDDDAISSRNKDPNMPNTSSTNQVIMKSQLLQQSVYNMHNLGDALQGTCAPSAFAAAAASKTNNASEKPVKSAFKRVPKKKTSLQQPGTAVKSTISSELEETKYAYTPDDFLNSNVNNNRMDTSSNRLSTNKSKSQRPPADIDMTNTKDDSAGVVSPSSSATPKTLEEQLDHILDVLLLQTKALKEGISTQQHVPGQAIGWKVHPPTQQ
ncbi:chromatin associated protein KTI12 [Nitzschia inconspicua]|uniref:Chromatin associated protein KTI12 n=1 Tax=Nitzschia inconspicua TaxID=303405 RepID=A0A9K3M0H0_9STRA|nr:chromatin associated protein KTI12 [Nitzschia inconspicua]